MMGEINLEWRKIRILLSLFLIVILISGSFLINKKEISVFSEVAEIPIYSVNKEEKEVALTFDVNWAENDNIYSILDILDKYNVKGTFFVMGGWVNYSDENVKKLKQISERGHEIGNHSYIHPIFTKIGEQRIKEELKKTDDIIEKYTGKKPSVFRFPSGDYNTQSYRTVTSLGYKCIQWSVDSVDWKEQGEDIEYNRVIKKVKPGSIFLYHNNAKYTPNNLDKLIPELQQQGYKFLTIEELIYKDDAYVDRDGVQNRK